MVERERRKGNAYVESPNVSQKQSWLQYLRTPLLLTLSILVFVLLLGELRLATKTVVAFEKFIWECKCTQMHVITEIDVQWCMVKVVSILLPKLKARLWVYCISRYLQYA